MGSRERHIGMDHAKQSRVEKGYRVCERDAGFWSSSREGVNHHRWGKRGHSYRRKGNKQATESKGKEALELGVDSARV